MCDENNGRERKDQIILPDSKVFRERKKKEMFAKTPLGNTEETERKFGCFHQVQPCSVLKGLPLRVLYKKVKIFIYLVVDRFSWFKKCQTAEVSFSNNDETEINPILVIDSNSAICS